MFSDIGSVVVDGRSVDACWREEIAVTLAPLRLLANDGDNGTPSCSEMKRAVSSTIADMTEWRCDDEGGWMRRQVRGDQNGHAKLEAGQQAQTRKPREEEELG